MNGEPFEVDILALPERADTRPRMSRSTSMSGIAARNRIAVRVSTYDGSWPNQAVSGRPERVLRVRASTQLRGEKRSGFVRASAASSRSKPPWGAMHQFGRHRSLYGTTHCREASPPLRDSGARHPLFDGRHTAFCQDYQIFCTPCSMLPDLPISLAVIPAPRGIL